MSKEILLPVIADEPSTRQRWFNRYLMCILIDLVVLNLFVEHSSWVTIDSFSISILAAILLQILLKLTLVVEHWLASYFKAKASAWATFMRWFSAWLVLFGSKFLILAAVNLFFGDQVAFSGPFHGVVIMIVVLFAMLIAEELVTRIFRKLA